MMTYLIIIAILILVVLYLNVNQKKKKQNQQETKKQQQAFYNNYISKFGDMSKHKKLEPEYTYVAGTKYKNDDGTDRQEILKKTKPGDMLVLLPDELNKFDKDAVKVINLSNQQLGFLNMDISLEIKSRLMAGSRVDVEIVNVKKNSKGVLQANIVLQKYSRRVSS